MPSALSLMLSQATREGQGSPKDRMSPARGSPARGSPKRNNSSSSSLPGPNMLASMMGSALRESFVKKRRDMMPIAEEQDGSLGNSGFGTMESLDLMPMTARSKELSAREGRKPEVLSCTVSDLLASQDLDEVFRSFKKHELEFETYLRPIMQEVLA